ncbi:MAG: hypothetical protein HOV79_05190 [Hamadaea sp.]|nr:hypothetical protein [Hamadaea sp.]
MGVWGRLLGTPQDRFAAEALRIARRTPGVLAARYDQEAFAIAMRRPDSSAPTWFFLGNAFGECQGMNRAQRRRHLERLIHIMTTSAPPQGWEAIREQLRPVLRPVTFGQAGPPGMTPPISRPAMPFLREFVVVDMPDSMAYIVPDRAAEWGVTIDDIFTAARANLAILAQRTLRRPWDADAIIRMIDTGDGYFTSLLLAEGWLEAVSERMGVPAVVFVPDVNNVLVCGRKGAIAGFYDLVEKEYAEAVRGISPVAYVAAGDGRVVPYRPDPDDPDFVAARRAEVVLAAKEYGAQTEWLRGQYEKAGIDVFVAGLLAGAAEGSPAITVATWTDGVPSLLPEAQFIAFQRDAETGPMVPWEIAAELTGLTAEPLLAPARYRVEGWPAPDVMDALRLHDVG